MSTYIVRDPTTFRVGEEAKRALHRSSIYVGSSNKGSRRVQIIRKSNDEDKYVANVETIDLAEGIERVYLETIVNACDIMKEARLDGCIDTPITVNITPTTVTIRNGGKLLPIAKNVNTGRYIPEEAFGILGTSSNYNKNINTTDYDETTNEDKAILGRNGVGAKLANVLSTQFDLKVAIGKERYEQTWTDNMSNVTVPNIYNDDTDEYFVQISYQLDFRRFEGRTEYTELDIELFESHCIDMAFTSRLEFIFNNRHIKPINFQEYVNIIYGESKAVFGQLWTAYTPNKDDSVDQLIKTGKPPTLEYACIDTPDKGRMLSFVNGSVTRDGGTHVDAVYRAVGDIYLKELNKRNTATKLSIRYIKKHLSVIVTANVNGIPEMNGNTKTKLTAPSFTVNLSSSFKATLDEFSLKSMLEAELDAGAVRLLGIKPSRHAGLNVPKLNDAAYASKPHSKRPDDDPVILIITEGDSAALFARVYIGDDRNHYGILPVRGKTINARKHTTDKILANKEYQYIVAAMGLKEGTDYTNDDNFKNIRYDKILIAADQDSDGEHIKGLLITLLHKRFPGILERGLCVEILISYIIAVTKGKTRIGFFHPKDYTTWLENNPDPKSKGWKTKYMKGLGSYTDDAIKQDRPFLRCVPIDWDANADESLELAFGSNTSDARKEWISGYDGDAPRISDKLSVTTFVKKHLVRHAIDSIERTIPMFDGMKQSVRKVMTACFDKWKMKSGECKTVALIGNIIENMEYHHGDASLGATICRLVCSYPGSNNLPLVLGEGQFGSRECFNAAKPRYTSVGSQPWWPYMFPKSDLEITPKFTPEDVPLEYSYIPQVLPIVLINGNSSLATGWSSYIPAANPKHVALYYRKKLLGENPTIFKPWYRGYHGKVKIVKTSSIKSILSQYSSDDIPRTSSVEIDQYDPDDLSKEALLGKEVDGDITAIYSLIIDGCFTVSNKGVVTITEIPIGVEIDKYKTWLKNLLSYKLIKGFEDKSTDKNGIHFIIKGFHNPSLNSLGLRFIRMLSNLTLLDNDGKPVTFNNIKELADTWYEWRLKQYPIRKTYLLNQYSETSNRIKYRIKYVELVLSGKIKVHNRPKSDWKTDIEQENIPYDLVKDMKISQLTAEQIAKLKNEFQSAETKRITLEEKTPEQLWIDDIDELLPHLK